jgi:hypothetical protein
MFHFVGYLIKNQNGDVVQFSPQRRTAEAFCAQNGLPPNGIVQAYELRRSAAPVDTTPTDEEDSSDESLEP